jgi:hypothetical protein
MFYVYCEDLAAALVGPFDLRTDAERHIAEVTTPRGDADPGRVVTAEEAEALKFLKLPLLMSAAEDLGAEITRARELSEEEQVMVIMKETNGNPEERELRLAELVAKRYQK